MHAEHGVTLRARVLGAKQIIDIASVSTFTTALLVSVLQHGPTSIRKKRMRTRIAFSMFNLLY